MVFDYDYIKNLDESGRASVRGDIRAKLEQAQAKWDALTAERDQLRADLAAVTAERDEARTDLTTRARQVAKLSQELGEALRERDELAAALRWIPVEGRLPEAHGKYLVLRGDTQEYDIVLFDAKLGRFILRDVAYWQPLLAAPVLEK